MKVRVGVGLGTRQANGDAGEFSMLVDALEDLGFDSLWLSERATGPIVDPLIALAVAAGRTERIKLGTSVQVLPGRNALLLAKEWASLDTLSGGRTLPAFGLGIVDPREQQAFRVERAERARLFDEALELLRRFWTEDTVTHHGEHFDYDGVGIGVAPVQRPPDVWLGGRAPGELKRVGRVADGWLPSFTTPELAVQGREVVMQAAATAGRKIDDEHWGVLVPYAEKELPDAVVRLFSERFEGVDPGDVIPVGLEPLRKHLERFIDVDFSKLVVVPFDAPSDWHRAMSDLADAVLDLQTR
ncbi:MAG TPA: LLM class flavin-dependent oxidoreductase [Acidimicrobiia bacterium]|jgi:probable F420-dependent oxidoreductase